MFTCLLVTWLLVGWLCVGMAFFLSLVRRFGGRVGFHDEVLFFLMMGWDVAEDGV